MDEDVKQYWAKFKKEYPEITDDKFGEAYSFGADDDVMQQNELAQLVYEGTKTATTSAYDLYVPDEEIPKVGNYDIILDGQQKPVCITKTVVVESIPFNKVSAEHAYHEGEGNRTLSYWRKVHEEFFKREYQEEGKIFIENANCLCEVFTVVYR